MVNGTKTRPVPMPWMKPETITSRSFIPSVKPDMMCSENAAMEKPTKISRRASTDLISRPTTIIEISVPMPRGAVTSPVSTTG